MNTTTTSIPSFSTLVTAVRAKSINLARAIDEAKRFTDIPRQSHELPLLKLAEREC